MKNVSRLFVATVFGAAFLTFALYPNESYCQKKTPEQTVALFPESVSGIIKNSCVGCHNDQSNGKSKTMLNFSDWDKLKKKERVKAGKQIMKQVIEKKMPPEGMVKRRPELALTPDQVKAFGSWAKKAKAQ
jgi:cytochrome c5